MSKTTLAVVWVFFILGSLLVLSKGGLLIGIGMLAFAVLVMPTISAIVWMRENDGKDRDKK